jgi:murein DD-endopeptidase MepM/ murein hydrolase activator NlpD
VLLSRAITLLLLMLSMASFGLVYALNTNGETGEPQEKSRFLAALIDPLLQDNIVVDDTVDGVAAAAPLPAKAKLTVFKAEEVKDGVIRRTLQIGRGETMTSRLIMAGVTRTEALRAMDALRVHVNPSKIRSGQSLVVLFTRENDVEKFTGFEIRTQPERLVTIARVDADSFRATMKEVQPERLRFAMRGQVNGSLYESGLKEGIPASILATLIKTYSYSIDFQRDVKNNDRFEVLYEQAVDETGQPGGTPTLIYAALQISGRITPIYRVAMPGGVYEYYDAKGESIRKGLLRTPVEGAHLTSGFGMRRHPLMGFSRMHKGVDFGAVTGTPIYAAGAGIIEESGWKSGYGRYVRIRHNNKVSTAYAHMNQFGRGIARGTRVAQGQVIGYVGASGMATGPHLHYEVMVDNNQVNPMTVALNTNASLAGRQLVAFQDWRGKIHGQFERLIAAAEPGTRMARAESPAQ